MVQFIVCFFISINLLFSMCCSLDVKNVESKIPLSKVEFERQIKELVKKSVQTEATSELLMNISPEHYTTYFIHNAQLLCQQCSPYEISAIKSFARVSPKNQPAFIKFFFTSMVINKNKDTSAYFADRLSEIDIQDCDHYQKMFKKMQEWSFFSKEKKSRINRSLLDIPLNILTFEFIDVVKHITPFFWRNHYIEKAIEIVHEYFSKEEYPLLKRIFDRLYKNYPGSSLSYIFYALKKIPHNELDHFADVVDIFYNAYGKDKEEIINALSQFFTDVTGTKIPCYKHYLNIGEPYLKTVLEFAKTISIDDAIESVARLHPSSLNQTFVQKMKQLTKNMGALDTKCTIKKFKHLDYGLLTPTHIAFFNMMDVFSPIAAKNILKIKDEQITTEFIEIIKKYQKFYYFDSMIQSLSYDEIMRIRLLNINLPDSYDLSFFVLYGKYLLLQETPYIELERYETFFVNCRGCFCILNNIHPNLHVFWVDFCLGNPDFISVIPFNRLQDTVRNITTEQQLMDALNRLNFEYAVNNAQRTRPGIAFEIHDFSNQLIMTENSTKKSFNDAVLDHIKKKIIVLSGTFNDVREQLFMVFKKLERDPLKPITQTEENFTWCMNRILDDEKENFIRVYDYVKSFSGESVPLWLQTFLDESTNAYDVQHGSCVRGINERLVTSLRNIPIANKTLQNYFHQAEKTFTNKAKIKKLSDYAFWAAQLKEKGILATTDKNLARTTFKTLLMNFFAPITPETQNIIDTTMESFDDSNAYANDGIWSKIKGELT